MLNILGKEVEVGRVYTVGMPKPSVIPSEGRTLICDLIKGVVKTDQYDPDWRIDRPYFMVGWNEDAEWEWLIHKGEFAGTLPKRLSAYVYKNSGFKLPPAILSEIGNIARRYTVGSNEYHFDFNTELDWNRGQFGDHGSCFWSERMGARDMIKSAGGYAVRFFREANDFSSGYARCWIIPHPSKSMLVLFNIYGFQGNQIVVPRVLSEFLGVSYNGRSIRYHNNGDDSGELYINGGTCWLVGQDAPEHTDRIDLEIEEPEDDERHVCERCDHRYHEDDMRTNDNGEWYCDDCYSELYGRCEGCGVEYSRDDLNYSDVSGDSYCDYCYNDRFYTCSDCGHEGWLTSFTARRGTSHEVDGEMVCNTCFERHYFTCERCDESHHNDDAHQVKSGGEDQMWCDGCLRYSSECVDCSDNISDDDIDDAGRCPDCRMKVEENHEEKASA